MTNRFKLRLSFPSFQFCRLKHRSSFPHIPCPATYHFSPINPKSFDISYSGFPEPPPSTPNLPLSKRHVSPAKIIPVDCGGCRSKSHHNNNTKSSPQYYYEEHQNKEKKTKASICISTSTTADRVWFSTEGSDYYNEETESFVSYSRSFDSSYEFDYSLETISESKKKKKKKKKKNFDVSLARMVVEGKLKGAFAVVKRSEDPKEDFKRSMMEMILEKEMVDAEDLEQLLQCFLSLNSRHHHAAIVGAFAEVWESLFCQSPDSRHVSMGH
ncbi:transcription repressor OFP8-like [Camellia sinensis]|uniref:Transcription repressor n=1 Tax=Camellia sinensis var. sinensis TaxID=542762 RepID=A0A4S4E0B6_CAMSN|nr:transcription repressor OFP8-like [Camellia sinensis]THG09218.1 hypothetical protein TEA_027404 [Camellia sinensis var. sinensis]